MSWFRKEVWLWGVPRVVRVRVSLVTVDGRRVGC